MCDYSLLALPNRLAAEGEELVVHRFSSGSLGLASPNDLHRDKVATPAKHTLWAALKAFLTPNERDCPIVAVCIPPSARLRIHDIPERFRKQHGLAVEEEVSFEQLTAAANTYRDAIVFDNGLTIKLQDLPEGLPVTVLDLAASEREVRETHASVI